MLSEPNKGSEEPVQEALTDLEGCSPELVAACLPDYPAWVAAAALRRFEPAFAATVRKLLQFDCWVHIVDGSLDLDISTQWLLSDADFAFAKQVVDSIGRLDRSRGEGMHRAVQIMKRLREGQAGRVTAVPKVTKPTNSSTSSAPLISNVNSDRPTPPIPPLANHRHSSSPRLPPPVVLSESVPENEPKRPTTSFTAPGSASMLLQSPVVDSAGCVHDPVAETHPRYQAQALAAPQYIPPLGSSSAQIPPASKPLPDLAPHAPLPQSNLPPDGPSTGLRVSIPLPNNPLGTQRAAAQPSSTPVLPSRGKGRRGSGPTSSSINQENMRFFAGTPLPIAVEQRESSSFGERQREAIAGPPAQPNGIAPSPMLTSPKNPPPPPTATSPSKSPALNSRMLDVPSRPENVLELAVDGPTAESSKSAPTSKSRLHRSPSPWEDDESGLESDDSYVPGSSEMNSSVNDDLEDLGEEIGPTSSGDETDETDEEEDETDESDETDDDKDDGKEADKTDDKGNGDETDETEDEVDRDEGDNIGDEVDRDEADEMDDEANGSSGENNDPLRRKKKKRVRREGVVEVEVSTAWTWKKETNDRLVREWRLEKEIDENPTVLHPVRTKWMYEARLKDLSEEDYEDMMRSEHQALMNVPPACRAFVGKMYYKRAKADWEVRVVLTALTWRYTQVKIKKEKAAAEGDKAGAREYTAEMTKILDNGMRDLLDRFPDLNPKHERRQIAEKLGSTAVGVYLQTLRTKVTSDAGRMSAANQKNGGTLGMLESGSAGRKVLGIPDILGKKRRDVAFHYWGGSSSGGRDECDKRIKKRMAKWKKLHPNKTAREISNKSLKVVCKVRKALFEALPTSVQQAWEEKAKNLHLPQTDEERQCLVDAVLPYLFRILAHLTNHTTLHFILLASGQGTSNVPVLAHEFSESTVDQANFFDANPALAQRIRSDYLKYALARHNTGQEEVVEGLPVMHTPDESPEEASVEALPTGSEKPQKSRGPIKPFQPDLSVVKTRSQRIEYMSRWFIAAGTQILGHKPSWDYLCKNMADYIVSERMPDDPLVAGKPLEIAKPSFMPDVRFDALWRFLLDSYNGNLPSRKRFMFKVEALHQNMPVPQPPGDETVHQAAMNSAKTAPLKKAAAKGAPRKGRTRKSLPLPSSEDELFDAPGIAEDEDAALLSAALADPAGHRRKRMTRSVLRVESPEASDFEADAPQGSAPRGFRLPRGVAQSGATSSNEPFTEASRQGLPPAAVEQTANSKSAEKRETDSSRKEKPPLPPTSSTPNVRIPPRPRGTLSPATEVLRHPSSPANSEDLLNRWNERLQDLMTWGRRMGVGWPRGKVLRYKGFVKKEWAALLPTGLDSVFCLLQLGAASQTLGSAAAQLSIAPSAGLENLRPNHPAAKAVNDVLNSQISLPSVKILNIQFGASPGASDGFFDFVEGTLIAFLGRALQSEDVFMDGNVDVMQLLRVAMFVVGTGFIRDFSGLSAHTTRTNALGDRVNVFLASMALVRYHHIVLGGAIGGFCRDESITGMEKDMWLLLMQTWSLAVRTMARAIVQHRSDLFDQKCLSTTLPDALDRMLQASLAIRPWWSWSEEGLPPPVTFTTKRSVASSCLYDTLGVLHWSSLTLLERSQYLLLVFLAAIQIHSGRVPKTWPLMGVPPAISSSANSKPLEGMMTYLIGLKALIAGSTELGDFEQPLSGRLSLPHVQECVARWQSESVDPEPIPITDEDEQMNDGASIAAEADPTPAIDASPSTPVTPICNIPSPALPSPSGKDSQGKTENSLVGDSTVGSPSSGSMPQLDRQAISGPGSPRAQQNTSDSSSESVLSCEPEDSIWPEGEGRPEQMRVERVDGEQGRSPPVIQATSPSGDRPTSPPGNDITSAPGVVDPVIPAIRPRSPSPTITPKQKRRRLIPEAPSNWRTEEPPLEGRQLRSTRPAPPPRAAAPAAVATGSSSGSLRKLATITETQQAGLRASQRRGQPSRPKRPAS